MWTAMFIYSVPYLLIAWLDFLAVEVEAEKVNRAEETVGGVTNTVGDTVGGVGDGTVGGVTQGTTKGVGQTAQDTTSGAGKQNAQNPLGL
ncbi:hypothetical protein MMC27_000423 [Xylographa pallens]|nr:hypothetical protein [Xylographa pallens]